MTTATATSPTRADAFMEITETITTRLATSDGRFVATFDHATRTYVLYDTATRRTVDLLADRTAVQRAVSAIIDHEHRAALLAYTEQLAAQDPDVAAFVARMRRAAAAHGRVTGALGMHMADHDGLRELAVYVDRSQYAALLDD